MNDWYTVKIGGVCETCRYDRLLWSISIGWYASSLIVPTVPGKLNSFKCASYALRKEFSFRIGDGGSTISRSGNKFTFVEPKGRCEFVASERAANAPALLSGTIPREEFLLPPIAEVKLLTLPVHHYGDRQTFQEHYSKLEGQDHESFHRSGQWRMN